MNSFVRRTTRMGLLLVSGLTLAACGGSGGGMGQMSLRSAIRRSTAHGCRRRIHRRRTHAEQRQPVDINFTTPKSIDLLTKAARHRRNSSISRYRRVPTARSG